MLQVGVQVAEMGDEQRIRRLGAILLRRAEAEAFVRADVEEGRIAEGFAEIVDDIAQIFFGFRILRRKAPAAGNPHIREIGPLIEYNVLTGGDAAPSRVGCEILARQRRHVQIIDDVRDERFHHFSGVRAVRPLGIGMLAVRKGTPEFEKNVVVSREASLLHQLRHRFGGGVLLVRAVIGAEDAAVQEQLNAMSVEERGKLAVTMLVTGMYMAEGNSTGGFNMNNALNSFLQSQISNVVGQSMDINLGMESRSDAEGGRGTDYNFQFAKRFWNNRFRIVIGGTVSTGNTAQKDETFIDNVAIEYRLDDSGTRYVKLFHDKNYESVLEGEVIETGIGVVLRKKVSNLGELFIFKKKKKEDEYTE